MRVVERIERPDELIRVFTVIVLVIDGDRGAEKDLVPARRFGIDGVHVGKIRIQEAHPAVDFAEPTFSVNIFGVFTAIALRRGFGHFIDDLGTLDRLEIFKFIAKSLVAIRCDVHHHILLHKNRASFTMTPFKSGQYSTRNRLECSMPIHDIIDFDGITTRRDIEQPLVCNSEFGNDRQ